MGLQDVRALTFDCYGTLIDWESGICRALRPILDRHGITVSNAEVLEWYGRFEAEAQSGAYQPYRMVLAHVMQRFAGHFGLELATAEMQMLTDTLPHWLPFPDTVSALLRLRPHFSLGILSNIDDDLFAATARHLPVRFDVVVTAEQVHQYKPARAHFDVGLQRLGLSAGQVLHVAQSLYHDVPVARSLGMVTAWVRRPGSVIGATGSAPADLEVPDLLALADRLEEAGLCNR
ncbi:MAG: haloacid dehalogenase type II [Chloroherpetonaceae bacterium]|nr:haloacid dehalogenase type II [Chthonomonadaceae bacterium]MDW8207885.1 haloacid dehalogenase type II [Chloroherpetonaceae bacterium]